MTTENGAQIVEGQVACESTEYNEAVLEFVPSRKAKGRFLLATVIWTRGGDPYTLSKAR
jgi:hypothetical protein